MTSQSLYNHGLEHPILFNMVNFSHHFIKNTKTAIILVQTTYKRTLWKDNKRNTKKANKEILYASDSSMVVDRAACADRDVTRNHGILL